MSIDMNSIVRVREPGLGQDWLGKERYVVKGGGVVVLPVLIGDSVEIRDPEGLQEVHVLAFNSVSEIVTDQLGLVPDIRGTAIAEMLHSPSLSALKIKQKLDSFSINPGDAEAARVLSGRPGEDTNTTFTSATEAICLICAPAAPMLVYEQNPPTDLEVFVTRANPGVIIANELPDPLGEQAIDLRIDASTAKAYEVKAGEYIQIIDVDGRQCSDFQCFDMAKLDKGVERCLDATTTRALMGSAYPGPGLFSKFYDVDFEPMLEVVHDTCGRHDSFGLACTSKYYDEVGYPGHVNCSENFNFALIDYPVAPRKGGWR